MKKAPGLETEEVSTPLSYKLVQGGGSELDLVIVLTHREPCEVVQYVGPYLERKYS